MYLRQEKDSIMNAPAFGYAPRGLVFNYLISIYIDLNKSIL